MSSESDIYKCKIADALRSSGELWELRYRTSNEFRKDILTRAVQNIGNMVNIRLAHEGFSPENGAEIYIELMTAPENSRLDIYQKMNEPLKNEIHVYNSKKYV